MSSPLRASPRANNPSAQQRTAPGSYQSSAGPSDSGPASAFTSRSPIMSVPSDWSFGSRMEAQGSVPSASMEGSIPLSASSSSSSHIAPHRWSQASSSSTSGQSSGPQIRDPRDPFDNTSSTFSGDPFDQRGSSSSSGEETFEEHMAGTSSWDPSARSSIDDQYDGGEPPTAGQGKRGSVVFIPHHVRSATDPLVDDGHAIDAEYAGLGQGAEGYNFGDPSGSESSMPTPPQFNRTFSAPLPARMGSLRHPLSTGNDPLGSHSAHPPRHHHSFSIATSPLTSARPKPNTDNSDSSITAVSSSPAASALHTPLQALSIELADSVQAAIETLVHLSPPHLLDNAKEQFSGCTVQIPSTSLSAMLTSMRTLNYLAANMHLMVGLSDTERAKDRGILDQAGNKHDDFDIGEMLQNVADLLSGQAARAGVDLVLFHGDVGVKHVSVNGDGEGLSFCLSHIIRQILLVSSKGDTIELGLQIVPQSPSLTPRVDLPLTAADVDAHRQRQSEHVSRPASPGRTTLPLPVGGIADGPVLCVIEIVHNIAQSPGSASVTPRAELNPFTRLAEEREATRPKLDTILCRRMLQQQNAVLKQDTQPSSPVGSGLPRRAYELSILLNKGKPLVEPPILSVEEEAIRQPFTTMRLAREPTLTELSQFAESLRGKKVMFHASPNSIFARHLISYLSAWGMEVSHVPFEDSEDALADTDRVVSRLNAVSGFLPIATSLPSSAAMPLAESTSTSSNGRDPDKFIMIDDDVAVLRRELIRIRAECTPLALKPRPLLRRPTMASRARSTPHMRQISHSSPKPSGPVLIHFTSLSNYNHVRDVVSNFLGSPYAGGTGAFTHAEVMVIPKPVGPRRFLTALHTAVNQPIVDPFFSPIATSPRSPGAGVFAPRTPLGSESGRDAGFFDAVTEETAEESASLAHQPPRLSPMDENPTHIARAAAGLHLSLPTPGEVISMPASEYFASSNNSKTSSAASGVVMQSPDGRPFGMFFEPPIKNDRKTSYSDRRSSYGFKPPSEGPRRKSTRRQSGSVKDDSGSQQASPVSARRSSGLSIRVDEDDSRRSSSSLTNGPINESPVRSTRRRTTLPNQPTEPIVAAGRDRAATVSKARKGPSASTSLPAPTEDSDAEAAPPTQPAFPLLKPIKRPTMSQNASERSVTKAKKEKPEMVVPPINVLIVEDNPININILSMFLRKKKIKYQTAKDGLEAVEKWRTGGFHLILMDIQLPVMNGIDATKEIRKLEKNNNIGIFPSTPVAELPSSRPSMTSAADANLPNSPLRSSVIIVALTASSYMTDRVAALAAGCNDFLTKPVSHRWLEQKIVEWGCMQALIDFDGWRRWRGSDTKGPSELKKAFQVGPQIAAKNLADRLKIQRKSGRGSPGPTSPTIQLQSATPPLEASLARQPADKGLEVETVGAVGGDLSDNKLSALQPAPQELGATDVARAGQQLETLVERAEPSPGLTR